MASQPTPPNLPTPKIISDSMAGQPTPPNLPPQQ